MCMYAVSPSPSSVPLSASMWVCMCVVCAVCEWWFHSVRHFYFMAWWKRNLTHTHTFSTVDTRHSARLGTNIEVWGSHTIESEVDRTHSRHTHIYRAHNLTRQRNFWIRDKWKFARKTTLSCIQHTDRCECVSPERCADFGGNDWEKSEKLPLITNSFRLNPDGWRMEATKKNKRRPKPRAREREKRMSKKAKIENGKEKTEPQRQQKHTKWKWYATWTRAQRTSQAEWKKKRRDRNSESRNIQIQFIYSNVLHNGVLRNLLEQNALRHTHSAYKIHLLYTPGISWHSGLIRAKTDVACSRIPIGRTVYHFQHFIFRFAETKRNALNWCNEQRRCATREDVEMESTKNSCKRMNKCWANHIFSRRRFRLQTSSFLVSFCSCIIVRARREPISFLLLSLHHMPPMY